MIIYPAIELLNGTAVTLKRGRLDAPELWHEKPADLAYEFSRSGAEWLHVTDLDAVAGEGKTNESLIEDIILTARVPVQMGGGIQTMDQIERWLDRGVARVVLGSAAIANPSLVREAAHSFPDQIVLSVDMLQGQVMARGWRTQTAFQPEVFLHQFQTDPLAAVLLTDIGADIDEEEASIAVIANASKEVRAPVIARGPVHSSDDISRLKYAGHFSGAILGRALANGRIDLAKAIQTAAAEPETVAPFV